MTNEQIKQSDSAYLMPTYGKCDVVLAEGSGCLAKDAAGKTYLDFTSGIGVNSLGWCDAEWAAAVSKQAATLQHTSNLFYTEPAVELAAELVARTQMDRVFFCNSGAEANECAIKTARNYSEQKYGKNRHIILTLSNSFHGRTLATLSATGQDSFHEKFSPLPDGFITIPTNDIEQLKKHLTSSVCAVMFEPIQGEGGVIALEKEYLQELQTLCHQKDVLLMADEIQTGIGRTGTFLACEQFPVKPDIITLAKGLGGGLPIGAILFSQKASSALSKGDHGSTFGGNPVCCAGALVVLHRLSNLFLQNVQDTAKYLNEKLASLPLVTNVSGMGLMLGVEFEPWVSAAEVQAGCLEKGVLFLTAKTKLRLLPPLIITKEEIDKGISILQEILQSFA